MGENENHPYQLFENQRSAVRANEDKPSKTDSSPVSHSMFHNPIDCRSRRIPSESSASWGRHNTDKLGYRTVSIFAQEQARELNRSEKSRRPLTLRPRGTVRVAL